jgi:aminopeptidase YwaD
VTDALAVARLLAGASNAEREAAVARWLGSRGVPLTRHRFETPQGRGESFAVDVGSGARLLVLCAHHDAVPGSPGANDNAAAVGILMSLLGRLEPAIPPGLGVRLLFTACEELEYLGAREYVRDRGVAGIAGVLSLELCGVGDSLVVWDAAEETPFRETVRGALESLGLRADDGYHVVGRIPRFGSDHRAFAAAGVPAYGLTVVPRANAPALRQFIFHPAWGALRLLLRRPVPFDTYHTPRDTLATLDPRALELTSRALRAVISAA